MNPYLKTPVVINWDSIFDVFEGDDQSWAEQFDLPLAKQCCFYLVRFRNWGDDTLRISKHTNVEGPMHLDKAINRYLFRMYPGIIKEIKVVIPVCPLSKVNVPNFAKFVKYYKYEMSKGISTELFKLFPTSHIQVNFNKGKGKSIITSIEFEGDEGKKVGRIKEKENIKMGNSSCIVISEKVSMIWKNSHSLWFTWAKEREKANSKKSFA